MTQTLTGADVLEHADDDEMSRGIFYLLLCGVVLASGFGSFGYASTLTYDWHPDPRMFFIFWFCVSVAGVFMSVTCDHWFYTLTGFITALASWGYIFEPLLEFYDIPYSGNTAQTACLTAVIVVVMGLTGAIFPKMYRSAGGAFYGTLIPLSTVVTLLLYVPEIGALATFEYVHYIVVAIFAFYVSFLMYRSATVPATYEKTVDVATWLYCDAISLLFWPVFALYALYNREPD